MVLNSCFLAVVVFVSCVHCLYIQEAHEMPRIQALARIGETAAATGRENTVIYMGNPGTPTQYRAQPMTYVQSYPTYGNPTVAKPGSTVIINVAEDQDPYYTMPAQTIRV